MVGCANFSSTEPERCSQPKVSPSVESGGSSIPAGIMGCGVESKSKFVKVTKAWKQILAKTSCGQGDCADPSGHLESGLAGGVCTHEVRSMKIDSMLRQASVMRYTEKVALQVPEVSERRRACSRGHEKVSVQEDPMKHKSELARGYSWKIVSDTRPIAGNAIPPSSLLHRQSVGVPGNKIDPKDLILEKCVGKGAFGTVYKANLRGKTVAVKVISHSASQPSIQVAPELELLHGICHPNIVHIQGVYTGMEGFLDDHESVACDTRSSLASGVLSDFALELSDKKNGGSCRSETWVVMGYCDQGSLWDAVRRGDLGIKGSSTEPHYSRIVEVALEVAFAMQHLHEVGIIHGDLKAQNVMLQGSKSSLKNFIAKVGDFGLCRRSPDRKAVTTFSYGTVDHMPPEVLEKGQVSFSTDVFSFAMLLIELITAEHPYIGMDTPAVIVGIVQGLRPKIPQSCPPRLADLIRICWEGDQEQRPTFGMIVGFLKDFMFSSKQPTGPVCNRTSSTLKSKDSSKRRLPARHLASERVEGGTARTKSDFETDGNLRQRRLLKAWGQYTNIVVNWPCGTPEELNAAACPESHTIFEQGHPRFYRGQGL